MDTRKRRMQTARLLGLRVANAYEHASDSKGKAYVDMLNEIAALAERDLKIENGEDPNK